MKRSREYSQKVYRECLKRATKKGVVYCEYSGAPTRNYQMHHIYGRKVESPDVCIILDIKNHDHSTGHGQLILNEIKASNSAMLIKKYGEDEARKKAGGKLFFTQKPKIIEKR